MDLIKTQHRVLATQRNTALLHIEDGLVEVTLCGGEAAGDGPGTRYVSDVATVLLLRLLEIYTVRGRGRFLRRRRRLGPFRRLFRDVSDMKECWRGRCWKEGG